LFIARVIKTVVSTIKNPKYLGRKLLFVEPLAINGLTGHGESIVAIDFAQAGVGDKVLVVDEGSSARFLFEDEKAPARSCIVGIVDAVDIPEGMARGK